MTPAPLQRGIDERGFRGAGAARSPAGKSTVKQLPWPGALLTTIAPWWPRKMPDTAASPRPRPVNFVEKKGSRSWLW